MALAIGAAPAHAATTRADYVAQADPICQAGLAQEAVAAQSFVRAVKRAQKHRKLRSKKVESRLARRLNQYVAQYATIEHQVNAQLASVPPAPDDVSLIEVWLRARNELVDLQSRLFSSFAHPKRIKNVSRLFGGIFELAARQFEVADLVRDFGFQYCTQNAGDLGAGANGSTAFLTRAG